MFFTSFVGTSQVKDRFGDYPKTSYSSDFTAYVNTTVDPKMAAEGPFKGEWFVDSSLDIEVQAGIEKHLNPSNALRFGMAYQVHARINYTKWSIMADYMLKDHLLWWKQDGFNQIVGFEFGSIRRKFDDAWYGDPNNYRKVEKTSWLNTPGVNVELQYMITPNIGLLSKLNWFRAENELIQYGKQTRWEVHVGLVFRTDNFEML